MKIPKEITSTLQASKRVLVISHYNPDADAYGSSLALALHLISADKSVTVVNESGILPPYSFIPGISLVESMIPNDNFDCCVCCDCGDLKRVGDSFVAKVKSQAMVINIDHHSSNDLFGHLNFVVPEASSTSELMLRVIQEIGGKITSEVATALYAGILADTGSFRYSSTSIETFEAAKQLVALGASPSEIANELFGKVSINAVRLQSDALSKIELFEGGKISFVTVTSEMLSLSGASKEDAENLVERARDIDGVIISVLLIRQDEIWKGSLRSRESTYDVSRIAKIFGGGGHKAAAGFRFRGELHECKERLLREAKATLDGNF